MTLPLAAVDLVDTDRLPELLIGLGFDAVAIAALAVLTYRRSRSRAISVFALVIVFWITMGFMTDSLVAYFRDELVPIIAGI